MSELNYALIKANIIAARDTGEANLRKQLAYLYRIFDYYGWCDLLLTHLSVRIPHEKALLIQPFGLTFNEVTPDNLIKVDFSGKIIDNKYGFEINKNGTAVHRSIYANRSEINCILHTHSHYGVAVANQEQDLLLLDQMTMMFAGKIGYHDFETLFTKNTKQEQLLHDMQGKYVMILKNHGLLSAGSSITEAFWFHYYLEASCKVHILTTSTGSKLQYPDKEIVVDTAAQYDLWRNHNDQVEVGNSDWLFDAAKRKIGYIFK